MLPPELQQGIEAFLENIDLKTLKAARESTSADYRKGADSHHTFQNRSQLLSYLVTRLPATYGAALQVFGQMQERLPNQPIRSLIDLGAGPGSATWAALDVFPDLQQLFLFEREFQVIEVGKKLSALSAHPAWKEAQWQESSLDSLTLPKADLAVLSYVIAEIPFYSQLIHRLFESEISFIAIIEPGTPAGFERIRSIRAIAIQQKWNIVAPCPHLFSCPMKEGHWCHFAARIERSRLHRQLKEGALGYEDEKYSYLILGKDPLPPLEGRVVGTPHKASGHVRLPLCAADGKLKEIIISRREKSIYKKARKAEWGTAWPPCKAEM
ncbi:MAG: hypothetical protein KGJ02_00035 [Verrucomicrobiota bacterium]|nr:hypothetical protein [Verrucomicrobiota bacterium]